MVPEVVLLEAVVAVVVEAEVADLNLADKDKDLRLPDLETLDTSRVATAIQQV